MKIKVSNVNTPNSTGIRDFTVTSFQLGVFTLLTLIFIMFLFTY